MRVLGMMSGTSHDAIDTAVVDLRPRGDVLEARLEYAGARPYPAGLRERIVRALPPGRIGMDEVCRLDTLIGQAFAEAAARAVAAAGPVDLVCSHGQTFYHWTEGASVRGTLQLGQPAWIAERLGVPVVADLRPRDVAAGGQGAPLVSFVDLLLLAGLPGAAHAGALNLGGIANLTAGGPRPCAYDIGPANALLDAAAMAVAGVPYDEDGRLAAAGTVDAALLADLLDEPYYRLKPPKTTGKELFNAGYVDRARARHPGVAAADLLRTLAALTARTVAAAVLAHGLDTVLVSGGGARNPLLMRELTAELAAGTPDGVRLLPSDAAGVPGDAKEAFAFAVLGWHTVHGLAATAPACTGARGARVLGTIVPGAAGRAFPRDAGAGAPSVLRVR